ncbi:unnamed protein product [Cochlearia groenlandica]
MMKQEEEANESFKSPNLEAERRRREKLHGRLMTLRSHVPIVTNMTKASIVEDAITYIGELQKKVENLTMNLHEIDDEEEEESDHNKMIKSENNQETNESKEEIKKLEIEENVQLCKIGDRKFWLKIITEKKDGIFTKLMEVMRFIGFEIIDISLTTSSETILICASVQIIKGLYDSDYVDVVHVKEFMLQVIRSN